MRGQHSGVFRRVAKIRIIPARAGPTHVRSCPNSRGPDHPRSCGANNLFLAVMSSLFGSSPLVRGQPGASSAESPRHRIIPARAGPTNEPRLYLLGNADHPRSCGANELTSSSIWRSAGSSPLVRGQRFSVFPERFPARIIPARAGPTRFPEWSNHSSTDHPRSCGANRVSMSLSYLPSGSSPLVRGQRFADVGNPYCIRIIPARAGPTMD